MLHTCRHISRHQNNTSFCINHVITVSLHIISSSFFLQLITQNCRYCWVTGPEPAQAQWADPQDLPGVLRWGLGMPLWSRDLWELQGVLQEGRGRSVWHTCSFRSSGSTAMTPNWTFFLKKSLKKFQQSWLTLAYACIIHYAAKTLCWV